MTNETNVLVRAFIHTRNFIELSDLAFYVAKIEQWNDDKNLLMDNENIQKEAVKNKPENLDSSIADEFIRTCYAMRPNLFVVAYYKGLKVVAPKKEFQELTEKYNLAAYKTEDYIEELINLGAMPNAWVSQCTAKQAKQDKENDKKNLVKKARELIKIEDASDKTVMEIFEELGYDNPQK